MVYKAVCIWVYRRVYEIWMSLHKLYVYTMIYIYVYIVTYVHCKNPLINLGMRRCNEHFSGARVTSNRSSPW